MLYQYVAALDKRDVDRNAAYVVSQSRNSGGPTPQVWGILYTSRQSLCWGASVAWTDQSTLCLYRSVTLVCLRFIENHHKRYTWTDSRGWHSRIMRWQFHLTDSRACFRSMWEVPRSHDRLLICLQNASATEFSNEWILDHCGPHTLHATNPIREIIWRGLMQHSWTHLLGRSFMVIWCRVPNIWHRDLLHRLRTCLSYFTQALGGYLDRKGGYSMVDPGLSRSKLCIEFISCCNFTSKWS
jgi:hypothetical protein